MAILHFALVALGVLLLFCLAILVHEFGHFLAAKLLGLQVDAFSIFFGPPLWKKKAGTCEYRIGCIPLGGYVALPQLDPSSMDAIQGKGDAEAPPPPPAPAWKRTVVAAAGPLGNVVLAVVLAVAIFAAAPDEDFGGYGTVVGHVDAEGPAAAAGLRPGDRILEIGGQPVSFWSEVVLECHFQGNTNSGLSVVVQPAGAAEGARKALTLPVARDDFTGYHRLPGVKPRQKCAVAEILPGSPAAGAGLRAGDAVVSLAGHAPDGPTDAVRLVQAQGTNAFSMVVRRRGASAPLAVTLAAARYGEGLPRPMIGVSFSDPAAGIPQWMMFKRPWRQLAGDAKGIFRILRALVAPKARGESGRAATDMGGPGTLLFVLWNEVQAGLFHSLAFLRFLCINLAILNLLPLPVLDGGHILFAALEGVTRRRPSPKLVDFVTSVFAFLLIGLMALLLVRDGIRIRKFARGPRPAAEQPGDE